MSIHAIVVAAGKGKRVQAEQNKCFLPLLGQEMVAYSLQALERTAVVESIVLVVGEDETDLATKVIQKFGLTKVKQIVVGGMERQDSVGNGLQALAKIAGQDDLIVVQDGARPLLVPEWVEKVIEGARETGAAVLAVPVKATIKRVGNDMVVQETPNRAQLWEAQTPQVMRLQKALSAFQQAQQQQFVGTDDVQVLEHAGERVKVVMGSYDNIKVTTPEDVKVAERMLEKR